MASEDDKEEQICRAPSRDAWDARDSLERQCEKDIEAAQKRAQCSTKAAVAGGVAAGVCGAGAAAVPVIPPPFKGEAALVAGTACYLGVSDMVKDGCDKKAEKRARETSESCKFVDKFEARELERAQKLEKCSPEDAELLSSAGEPSERYAAADEPNGDDVPTVSLAALGSMEPPVVAASSAKSAARVV